MNGAEGGRMAAVLRHYGMDVPEGYGDRWRPLRCGFHDDAHASASYNEELDAFACMACDVKGNAVTLLMRVERLSGREADARATELAGHPGVSLAAVPARMRGGARYSSPRMRRRSA